MMSVSVWVLRSGNVKFYDANLFSFSVSIWFGNLDCQRNDHDKNQKEQLTCWRLIINSFRSNMLIDFSGFTAFFSLVASSLIIISKGECFISTLVNFNIYSPPPKKFFLSWLTTSQLIAKNTDGQTGVWAQYGSQFIQSLTFKADSVKKVEEFLITDEWVDEWMSERLRYFFIILPTEIYIFWEWD